LPEAYETFGTNLQASLYIILGLLLFFVLEKFLRWRHCHIPTSQNHPHPMVTMNAIGDSVHNLIDGMLIGASFLVSTPLGISTTLAVVAHEIPQEMGDFGVLIHGGLSPKKAVLVNLASAALAFLGVFISLTFGRQVQGYTAALVPITAGGFIYLAGSDLIPALHDSSEIKESLGQFFFICLGVGVMALMTLIE
ncbi:MAG: ZIP family metal transporter, partial [bacterium]|nr:ZIP family metal transporter [bacterium]